MAAGGLPLRAPPGHVRSTGGPGGAASAECGGAERLGGADAERDDAPDGHGIDRGSPGREGANGAGGRRVL